MIARAFALRGPQRATSLLWFGSGLALSLAASIAVARGDGLYALAALVVPGAFVAGIANWRRHTYALLAFLPLSGIPIVALYPHTSIGVLVGDLLFVLPLYAGFLTEFLTQRRRLGIDGVPTVLLVLLGALVVGQAFNPTLPNLLVGAIGIKTWLLYIPMLFVGYHLVSSKQDIFKAFSLMAAMALLPLVIGIAQAALISAGHSQLAYRPYGSAAAAVSQDFAHFGYGTGTLGRVPSTFSFVTQYYLFTIAMIAITYALWRGALVGTARSGTGRFLWLLALAGAFLTGSRGAFLMAPLLVLMIVLLEQGKIMPALGRILAPALMLAGAAAVIGAAALELVRRAFGTAGNETGAILVDGFRQSLRVTWVGLGSGIDSSGSRYALPTHGSAAFAAGSWNESWYAKTVLELGVPGLCVVLLLIATLVIGGIGRHRRVHDPRLRAVSAALLAFLFWVLINDLKGRYLDLDPVNIYFWLFAGMLIRTWALDRERHPANRAEAP